MENNTGIAQQGTNNLKSLKEAINSESIQTRFRDMLGKKSAGFLSNLMACVQNNDLLQKADVNSIILAAARSAALDLPIDPNLGQAAIIPFNDKKSGKCRAELQIMRDGFVELCLRTGQFEWIVNEPVFDGELVEKNRFTNTYVFDEYKRKPGAKIIGYMAAFKLTNGYSKTVYWTVDECKEHGKKYSKTFGLQAGLWTQNFQGMSLKTVLKHLLKKYAPKSIEAINLAIKSDQASFSGTIDKPVEEYIDNPSYKQADEPVQEFQEAEVIEYTTTTTNAMEEK
jgi:recombination protein RecT